MITWTGKSTDGRWVRTVQAESFYELINTLIDKGYIPHYADIQGQLFYKIAEILPYIDSINRALDADDELTYSYAVYELENLDWKDEVFNEFTDEDYIFVIRGCDSQAYYQDFVVE